MPGARSRKRRSRRSLRIRAILTPSACLVPCRALTAPARLVASAWPRSKAWSPRSIMRLSAAALLRAAGSPPSSAAAKIRRWSQSSQATWPHAGIRNAPWRRSVSDRQTQSATPPPLLQVANLAKRFPVRAGLFRRAKTYVHAVDGVSFTLAPGETLGIVGESGCGKSTLARMIVRLVEPSAGTIRLSGIEISALSARAMRRFRRDIQFVFQDPYASLNPRLRAGAIVGEAIENFEPARRREISDRVAALFARVGLRPAQMRNFPHEF